MNNICIIGCGGHARSVAEVLIHDYKDVVLTFYDENAKEGEMLLKRSGGGRYEVYPISQVPLDNRTIFFAIGDNVCRKESVNKFDPVGNAISIISNHAYVSEFSQIGHGCFVANNAYIGPEVVIGNYSIINTAAIVEHEVKIGEFSHISVNTTVCGRCTIGNNVFLGAGAVVKDKIAICDDVVIGANALVVKDITASGVYVGNPARKIR